LKKIIIIIEIHEDDARASGAAEHVTVEPDQAYWQDEMDDMLDDYD
jgi:hypothetical protein